MEEARQHPVVRMAPAQYDDMPRGREMQTERVTFPTASDRKTTLGAFAARIGQGALRDRVSWPESAAMAVRQRRIER